MLFHFFTSSLLDILFISSTMWITSYVLLFVVASAVVIIFLAAFSEFFQIYAVYSLAISLAYSVSCFGFLIFFSVFFKLSFILCTYWAQTFICVYIWYKHIMQHIYNTKRLLLIYRKNSKTYSTWLWKILFTVAVCFITHFFSFVCLRWVFCFVFSCLHRVMCFSHQFICI